MEAGRGRGGGGSAQAPTAPLPEELRREDAGTVVRDKLRGTPGPAALPPATAGLTNQQREAAELLCHRLQRRLLLTAVTAALRRFGGACASACVRSFRGAPTRRVPARERETEREGRGGIPCGAITAATCGQLDPGAAASLWVAEFWTAGLQRGRLPRRTPHPRDGGLWEASESLRPGCETPLFCVRWLGMRNLAPRCRIAELPW